MHWDSVVDDDISPALVLEEFKNVNFVATELVEHGGKDSLGEVGGYVSVDNRTLIISDIFVASSE